MTRGDLVRLVEDGTGGDRKLDGAIWCAICGYEFDRWDGAGVVFFKENAPSWDNGRKHEAAESIPRYTASLDAAISLVEKMLPGWWYSIAKTHPDFWSKGETHPWGASLNGPVTWVKFDSYPEPDFKNIEVSNAPSAPRAVLIALLKALEHKEGEI